MDNNQQQGNGFTFTEVLVVIGILGIIAGLGIPFYQSFQVTSDLNNTTQEIIQTLRRAQSKAMSSEFYSPYGVYFENKKFVLFQGSAYNPVDPLNETVTLSNVLSISSGPGPEIVFSQVQGITADTGLITISTSRESKIIDINEMGVVNEQ